MAAGAEAGAAAAAGGGAGVFVAGGWAAAGLGAALGFGAAFGLAGALGFAAPLDFADPFFAGAFGWTAVAFAVFGALLVFGVVAPAAPAVFATGFDILGVAGAFGLAAALGAAFVAAGLELAEAAFGAVFGLAVVFFGVVAITVPLLGVHHFKRITDRFVAVIALWRPINETAAR